MLKSPKSKTPVIEKEEVTVDPRLIEMVTVPAGEVIMGTSEAQAHYLLSKEDWAKEWIDRDLFLVEQPQHHLSLAAFSLAIHPVTNAQYRLFVWDTGHKTPRSWVGFDFEHGKDDHPVVDVSWNDAHAYLKWLREKTGQPYRLPTEAEWEKAARGTDDRFYPWGRDFDPWRCNTVESGKRGTTVVRHYTPGGDSPSNLTDMAGNVYEWTASLLRPYPYVPNDGREHVQTPAGEKRVVRGGAWYYSRKLARCSSREGLVPGYVSHSVGFRLALSVE
jgi:formylglycine-generating enzyme required for sulfatase activity